MKHFIKKIFISFLVIAVYLIHQSCQKNQELIKTKAESQDTLINKVFDYDEERFKSRGYYTITLLNLLTNPDKYHLKKVQIKAYMHLAFECYGLFMHKEDYVYGTGNCLWIELPSDFFKDKKKINNCYVIVKGIFNKNRRGHFGSFRGTIENVERLDSWK